MALFEVPTMPFIEPDAPDEMLTALPIPEVKFNV